VDHEVSNLYREHRFRKALGGSHEDFMNQPREITDWLLAIDDLMNEVQRG